MAFLNSIEKLRAVQWSSQLLWDVKFFNATQTEDPTKRLPKPFDEWFPAQTVEDQTADLETFQLETAQKPLFFPKMGGKKTIKLTFVDDSAHQLHSFFETWIESTIQNEETHISTVSESTKFLQVVRLTPNKEIIADLIRTYLVFPISPLIYEGSDKPDPNQYSITFVKVGHVANPE